MTAPERLPDASKPTILILDDDNALRGAAARVLAKSGYRVLTAATAAEALRVEAETAEGIDLLLCDLVLPGLSGREAANALLGRRPDLKVLFTSGYSSRGSFRGDMDQPGWTFLAKPFDVEELMGAVQATLRGDPWPPRRPGAAPDARL